MRRLLLLLLVTACALGASPQADPVTAVQHYYQQLGEDRLIEAYELHSPAYRQKTSQDQYLESWKGTIKTQASGLTLAAPETVDFTQKSLEYDLTTGARANVEYRAQAKLVRDNDLWWIDDIQLTKVASTPYEGYEIAAFGPVKPGKVPPPKDIPVYKGFHMSGPLLAHGVKTVVSLNRQKDVQPKQVLAFYEKTLKAAGWKTGGAAGSPAGYSIVFRKAKREVVIRTYRTIYNGDGVPLDPRGTALEINY